MSQGSVVEVGSPSELVNAATNADGGTDSTTAGVGTFASMVDAGGPAVSQRLRALIAAAAETRAAQASPLPSKASGVVTAAGGVEVQVVVA